MGPSSPMMKNRLSQLLGTEMVNIAKGPSGRRGTVDINLNLEKNEAKKRLDRKQII
jgi:hypothetical protein